jgi:hypothetical protein
MPPLLLCLSLSECPDCFSPGRSCAHTNTHIHALAYTNIRHATEDARWGDLDPGLFSEHAHDSLDEAPWPGGLGGLGGPDVAHYASHGPAGGGVRGEERGIAGGAQEAADAHEAGPAPSHAACVSSDVVIIIDD